MTERSRPAGAQEDDRAPEDRTVRDRIAEIPDWYHTLELAPGVTTPGWFDTRDLAETLPIPASLEGRRCLDVGTFDGFWAFELERRGAAEVLAVDIVDPRNWDWPAGSTEAVLEAISQRKAGGHGFEVAREALGSSVERLELSVYDLEPSRVGVFDYVYLGSLLLHLRDPVGALMAVRSVCEGELLLVDAVDPVLSRWFRGQPAAALDGVGRPWWWKPNVAGLVRMVEAAGFEVIASPQRVYMQPGASQGLPRVRPRMFLSRRGREQVSYVRKGDPHAAIRARPIE